MTEMRISTQHWESGRMICLKLWGFHDRDGMNQASSSVSRDADTASGHFSRGVHGESTISERLRNYGSRGSLRDHITPHTADWFRAAEQQQGVVDVSGRRQTRSAATDDDQRRRDVYARNGVICNN